MRSFIFSNYFYLVMTVLLTVSSQLIIKWKMSTLYHDVPIAWTEKACFLLRVLSDPYIILSVFLVLFSGLSWMIAMTKFDLSSAYPIIVVGLMMVTSIASVLLFKESINIYKVVGIIVSLFGIFILQMGQK
ncbi:hypothetical protein NM22_15775 [Vibrio tubiashii]|nr:hypothetical protein NM22_15775 [Vibrio tubiashii]